MNIYIYFFFYIFQSHRLSLRHRNFLSIEELQSLFMGKDTERLATPALKFRDKMDIA